MRIFAFLITYIIYNKYASVCTAWQRLRILRYLCTNKRDAKQWSGYSYENGNNHVIAEALQKVVINFDTYCIYLSSIYNV